MPSTLCVAVAQPKPGTITQAALSLQAVYEAAKNAYEESLNDLIIGSNDDPNQAIEQPYKEAVAEALARLNEATAKLQAEKLASFEVEAQNLLQPLFNQHGCALHYTKLEAFQARVLKFDMRAAQVLGGSLNIDSAFKQLEKAFHQTYALYYSLTMNEDEVKDFITQIKAEVAKNEAEKNDLDILLANHALTHKISTSFSEAERYLELVKGHIKAQDYSKHKTQFLKDLFQKLAVHLQQQAQLYYDIIRTRPSLDEDLSKGFIIRTNWRDNFKIADRNNQALKASIEGSNLDLSQEASLNDKILNLEARLQKLVAFEAEQAILVAEKIDLIKMAKEYRQDIQLKLLKPSCYLSFRSLDLSFMVEEVPGELPVMSSALLEKYSVKVQGLLLVLKEVQDFISNNEAASLAVLNLEEIFQQAKNIALDPSSLIAKELAFNELQKKAEGLEQSYILQAGNLPTTRRQLLEKITTLKRDFPSLRFDENCIANLKCPLDQKIAAKVFSQYLIENIKLSLKLVEAKPRFSAPQTRPLLNWLAAGKKFVFDKAKDVVVTAAVSSILGWGPGVVAAFFTSNMAWEYFTHIQGVSQLLYPFQKLKKSLQDIQNHHKVARRYFRLACMGLSSLVSLYYLTPIFGWLLASAASLWLGGTVGAVVGKLLFKLVAAIKTDGANYDRLTIAKVLEDKLSAGLTQQLVGSVQLFHRENPDRLKQAAVSPDLQQSTLEHKKSIKQACLALETIQQVDSVDECAAPLKNVLTTLFASRRQQAELLWNVVPEDNDLAGHRQKVKGAMLDIAALTRIDDKVKNLQGSIV